VYEVILASAMISFWTVSVINNTSSTASVYINNSEEAHYSDCSMYEAGCTTTDRMITDDNGWQMESRV